MTTQLCGARYRHNMGAVCGKPSGHLATDPFHHFIPGNPDTYQWLDHDSYAPTDGETTTPNTPAPTVRDAGAGATTSTQTTESDAVLDAAILATVDLESREPDPSVEQYARAVLAAVATLVMADAMTTAADLAETCETGTHAAQVIRFTARSLSRVPTTPPGPLAGGEPS